MENMKETVQRDQSALAPEIHPLIEDFQVLYQSLNRDTLSKVNMASVYHERVVFEDCFHHIDGLDDLFSYFKSLYENVEAIQFEFHEVCTNQSTAILNWTMTYQHPSLNKGQPIKVEGASKLVVQDDRIISHRDYFDAGNLLYEHIPVLKNVIRFLKRRMS